MAPPFGKGCCGVLKLQKWLIGGILVMGRGLDSGKITDLRLVVLQSSFGKFILLLMNGVSL
jgi:hypothetical protein